MGKAKKGPTRRVVGGGSPVGEAASASAASAALAAATTSDNVVSKLNSLDAQKRLAALIMLHDLLIQNQWRPRALVKLASRETLTALSVRLLDANVDVMKQAVLCVTTMCRLKAAGVADQVHAMGIDATAVRLLSDASRSMAPDDAVFCMLLELVHVVYSTSVTSAMAMQGAVVAVVLLHRARLRHHPALAQFVCDMALSQQGGSDALRQLLHAERLPDALIDVIREPDRGHDVHVDTLLLATLLHVLTAVAAPFASSTVTATSSATNGDGSHNGAGDDDVISTAFSMLIERVGTEAEAALSSETSVRMKTVRTASKAVSKMCSILLGSCRHPVLERLLQTYGNAGLAAGVSNYFKTALSTAGRYATAVASHAHSATTSDAALTEPMDVCEQLLHDVGESATLLAADPPPKLLVAFEGDDSVSFDASLIRVHLSPPPPPRPPRTHTRLAAPAFAALIQQLVAVLSALHDTDDIFRTREHAPAATTAAPATTALNENDAEARGLANVNCRESISCSMESALETLLGLVHVAPTALLVTVFADVALAQGLALLLCRSCTSSFDGVALAAIALVGLLAQKDGQHRAEPMHQNDSPVVVAPKINALLSNAVLRVADACVASVASGVPSYEQLSVIDAALSAFVDLHSSDDADVLQNYVRLHAPKKLTDVVAFVDASLSSAMTNDEWDPSDLEETLENVKGLLAYKAPFL